MKKLTEWFRNNVRLADTSNGVLMKKKTDEMCSIVKRLKAKADSDGFRNVLPRFRAQVRRAVQVLPPVVRVRNMDMWELAELSVKLSVINDMLERYRQKEA